MGQCQIRNPDYIGHMYIHHPSGPLRTIVAKVIPRRCDTYTLNRYSNWKGPV